MNKIYIGFIALLIFLLEYSIASKAFPGDKHSECRRGSKVDYNRVSIVFYDMFSLYPFICDLVCKKFGFPATFFLDPFWINYYISDSEIMAALSSNPDNSVGLIIPKEAIANWKKEESKAIAAIMTGLKKIEDHLNQKPSYVALDKETRMNIERDEAILNIQEFADWIQEKAHLTLINTVLKDKIYEHNDKTYAHIPNVVGNIKLEATNQIIHDISEWSEQDTIVLSQTLSFVKSNSIKIVPLKRCIGGILNASKSLEENENPLSISPKDNTSINDGEADKTRIKSKRPDHKTKNIPINDEKSTLKNKKKSSKAADQNSESSCVEGERIWAKQIEETSDAKRKYSLTAICILLCLYGVKIFALN